MTLPTVSITMGTLGHGFYHDGHDGTMTTMFFVWATSESFAFLVSFAAFVKVSVENSIHRVHRLIVPIVL